MMPKLRRHAALAACIAVLACFALHFLWAWPHSDDYSYDYFFRKQGYAQASAYIFNYSGGRFVSTFLILLSPLSVFGLTGYRLLLLMMFAMFVGSVCFFANAFLKKDIGTRKALSAGVLGSVVLLSFMPRLHEFSYWCCATATYEVAASACLSGTAALFAARKNTLAHFSINILCALSAAACSEAGILIYTFILICAFWLQRGKPRPRTWYVNAGVFVGAALFASLSGGNVNRHGITPFSGNILLAAGGGMYASAFLFVRFLPLLLTSFVLWLRFAKPLLPHLSLCFAQSKLSTAKILSAGFVWFVLGHAAAVWMAGSIPEQRFENVFFAFLLVFILAAAQASNMQIARGTGIFAGLVLSALFLFNSNFTFAARDLFSGEAEAFDQENRARAVLLRSLPGETVCVPSLTHRPKLLYYPLFSCSAVQIDNDVPQRTQADYFGKKWIFETPCDSVVHEFPGKTFLKTMRARYFKK